MGIVILELLPIADLIGNKDEEGLGLPDSLVQCRLPEMAISKMCLIDENVRAGNCLLDRCFERERALTVRRVVAQKHAQRGSPRWPEEPFFRFDKLSG